jgi:hypothetical protein
VGPATTSRIDQFITPACRSALRSLPSHAACFALQAAFFAARVLRTVFFIAGISTPIARAPILDNNLRLDATILASYGLILSRRATSVRVIVRIGHVFACSMSASIAAWAAVLLAIIGDAWESIVSTSVRNKLHVDYLIWPVGCSIVCWSFCCKLS